MPDLMRMAERERRDLLDLLRSLTCEQWLAPSLCPGWTVRDVAVHVVSYDGLSAAATAALFLRGGLRVAKINELALHRHQGLDPSGLVEFYAQHLRPSGLPTGFAGGIALTDGTIHHQDIRRALDLPRTIPQERLRPVLDFCLKAPTLPARRNAKGLALVATDLDWRAGSGPEVHGPGEALLMAAAGRRDALADLAGEGWPLLQRRLGDH